MAISFLLFLFTDEKNGHNCLPLCCLVKQFWEFLWNEKWGFLSPTKEDMTKSEHLALVCLFALWRSLGRTHHNQWLMYSLSPILVSCSCSSYWLLPSCSPLIEMQRRQLNLCWPLVRPLEGHRLHPCSARPLWPERELTHPKLPSRLHIPHTTPLIVGFCFVCVLLRMRQ